MSKLQFWTCLFLASGSVANSQMLIKPDALLASARHDPAVVLQGDHLDFRQQQTRSLPWVEQIGFQTETNRFELRRQEYMGRVKVNGLNEISRQNDVHASEQAVDESRERLAWHEALGKRYATAVQYRGLQRQLGLQEQLLLVFDDKIRVLRKLAELSADADVEDLIKVEYDRDELALRQTDAQNRLRQLRQYIQVLIPNATGDWQLDTSGMIAPLQLETVLSGIPLTPANEPNLVEKQAKINLIDAKSALERARSEQVLDFLQLRYQNHPNKPARRDYAISAGFNLPYKGSSRVRTAELAIEKHAAEAASQAYSIGLSRKIFESSQHLANLGAQYRQLQQQMADSQALFSLRQAQTGQPADPVVVLKAREVILKRQIHALELEQDMFNEYLDLLDLTGRISFDPPVNYLSASLGEF